MHCINTADYPRIGELTRHLRAASRAESPQDSVARFGVVMRELYPVDGALAVSRRGLEAGQYKITRNLIRHDVESGGNPWAQWASIPAHRDGFVGEVTRCDFPELILNMRVEDDPVVGDLLAPFGSCLAVPVFDAGEPLNWTLLFKRSPEGFSVEEMEQRLLLMNLNGRATKNLVTVEDVKRLNARLTQQLERIASIQQSLLPDRTPDVPGVRLATSYLTSDEAGGDYYDFFELPEGRLGIFLGDVSGHGAGAATVMAMLHALLHAFPHLDGGPDEVLRYANRHLVAKRIESSFVTALFAVYDPATRVLRWANAGHLPARLKPPGTRDIITIAQASAPPLGVLPEAPIAAGERVMHPGETLVLYTDGITEAFSPAPDRRMFGVAGLDRALADCSGEPDCVVDSIHSGLFVHVGEMKRDDDQTLVVLRFEDRP